MITKKLIRELLTKEMVEIDKIINSGAFKVILVRAVEHIMEGHSNFDPDEFITRKELAKRWNVHTNTIASYHDRKKYSPSISYYQFGKSISYKWSECLEFANQNFKTRD